MKLTNKIGVLLLAIWLIMNGILALAGGGASQVVITIMAILAIVAGAFLVVER